MLKGRLTPGRWALHRGQIGIVNALPGQTSVGQLRVAAGGLTQRDQVVPDGHVDFHYVDEHGETTGTAHVPIGELDTPERSHIPAKRLDGVHPDWKPGESVRFVEGVSARSDNVPEGRHSLEFVDDQTLADWPVSPLTGDVPDVVQRERARRAGR